jgi:hypothetical protein
MNMMLKVAACALGVVALTGAAAWAVSPAAISQTSIVGMKLGMSASAVKTAVGGPAQNGRGTFDNPGAPDTYARVFFPKRKVAAYFEDGSDKAIIVTTWNKAYRTAAGVGPCSTLAQVKAAYRSTLKPSKNNISPEGAVFGYRVGKNLLFAFDARPPTPSPTVTAVGLYNGGAPVKDNTLGFAGFVTLSEPNC